MLCIWGIIIEMAWQIDFDFVVRTRMDVKMTHLWIHEKEAFWFDFKIFVFNLNLSSWNFLVKFTMVDCMRAFYI